VACHFFKDFDTTPAIYERICQTYDGPLSLAEDYMVWNITKDEMRPADVGNARMKLFNRGKQ